MGRRHGKNKSQSSTEEDYKSSKNKPKKKINFGVLMLLEKIQNSKKLSPGDKKYLLDVLNLDKRSKVLLRKRMMIFNEILRRVAKSKKKLSNKKTQNTTKRHKREGSCNDFSASDDSSASSSDVSSKKRSKKRKRSKTKRKKRRKAAKKHRSKSTSATSSSQSSHSCSSSTDMSLDIFKLDTALETSSKETVSDRSDKIKKRKKLEKKIKMISKRNKGLAKKINKSLEYNSKLLKGNLTFLKRSSITQHSKQSLSPPCVKHSRSVHFVEQNNKAPTYEKKYTQALKSSSLSDASKKNYPLDSKPVQINYIVLTPTNQSSNFKRSSSLPGLDNIRSFIEASKHEGRPINIISELPSKHPSFVGSDCLRGHGFVKILPEHSIPTAVRYYNDYDDYLDYNKFFEKVNRKKVLLRKKTSLELLREDINVELEQLAKKLLILKNNGRSLSNIWDNDPMEEFEDNKGCRLYDIKYGNLQNFNKCNKNLSPKDEIIFMKVFPKEQPDTGPTQETSWVDEELENSKDSDNQTKSLFDDESCSISEEGYLENVIKGFSTSSSVEVTSTSQESSDNSIHIVEKKAQDGDFCPASSLYSREETSIMGKQLFRYVKPKFHRRK